MNKLNIIFVLSVLFLCLLVVDCFYHTKEEFKCTVVDKHYKASSESVGTGNVIGSNGVVSVVSTYEYESEKFILIVETLENEIITIECDPKVYYSLNKESKIVAYHMIGNLFGFNWGAKVKS